VAGQKYEYGTFWIIAHVYLTLPARFSISPAEARQNPEDWTHIADASKNRNRIGLVIVSRRFIVAVPLGRGGAAYFFLPSERTKPTRSFTWSGVNVL